ncbi:MAG: hypothetical protein Q9160_008482 [Pyrenula sp. 1 TL-2023]
MQFRSYLTLCCIVASTTALVDLPQVSSVVTSGLKAFHIDTAYHAPTIAPSPTLDSNGSAVAAPKAFATPAVNVNTTTYGNRTFGPAVADTPYWLASIAHQGRAAFNSNPSGFRVFRNVKDYGAAGDGVTDDTAAINSAIASGRNCAPGSCQSSTVEPVIVYFPAGTYVISSSIVDWYFTQIIGNPNALPVLKATPGFVGLGLIDGDPYQPGGAQGYTSVGVFYRQVRNLILDLTAIPASTAATGIHWPVGQATSIQNVQIRMTSAANSQQQGIFIENGSGGFLVDITITGGLYGANVGNQQFTTRNLRISNAVVGISQIWSWGWQYQGITITNCQTAFSMTSGGSSSQQVGSINIIDSTISGCSVFVDTAWTPNSSPPSSGSLILENVALNNVATAVRGPSSTYLAGTTGSTTIAGWGQGHRYTPNGPQTFQGSFTPVSRPGSLLGSGNSYYTQSKPQYEQYSTSSFLSIRSAGARGDGSTDDTTAIQNAITSAASSGQIVFFDHGTYKVTRTIYIPPGSRIVGETYPVIVASGSLWSSATNPVPVVQVGRSGEGGSVQWSDMVIGTQGSAPGAVLIEYNLNTARGSGVWDVHTRVGGFAGSNQQVSQCPVNAAVSSSCLVAHTSIHITSTAIGAYFENTWFWTADHDLDTPSNTQISVYTGRGMLLEASTVWLYGTAVEHHALYQYQFANTNTIMVGFAQTETPYWQPNPNAINQPYPLSSALNDPNYASFCSRFSGNCDSLGLRILNSNSIFVYGGGFYSFFNSYSTTCSNAGGPENCQSAIVSIEGSGNVRMYNVGTVGSQSMIAVNGGSVASYADNVNVFPDTIAYFSTS